MKQKRRSLSLALALLLALAFTPPIPARADDFTPVTGADMLPKIMLGINFGNSLEPNPNNGVKDGKIYSAGLETQTHWGEAKIEQWQMKAVAQKGFTAVRLPVTWECHMDSDYQIDGAWLDRVQQCVDWAVGEGLYVIINSHHEIAFYGMIRDGKYDQAKKYLTAVWTQVAERLEGYSEMVMFEPMNEPNINTIYGKEGGWIWDSWDSNGVGHVDRKLADMVNRLNIDALDAIRAVGGNNEKRCVVLCVPGANCDAIEFYKQPDDPYTMLGVFVYPGDDVNKIKPAADKGVPVIVKETSSLSDTLTDAEKLAWTKTTFAALAKMEVPSFWWNCGDPDTAEVLFDRHTGQWPHESMTEAVFAAYGQTPNPDYEYTPPPPALPYDLTVSFTDGEYTFWTPPRRELAAAEKIVVEYDGALSGGWYSFSRFSPEPSWAQYDSGDRRITAEKGKITFDLRGLEGNILGFFPPNGDSAKIKRVYIDTWEGVKPVPPEKPAAWAETGVARAVEAGIVPQELQGQYGQDITRAEFCALAAALYEAHTGKPIIARQSFPDDRGDVNIRKMAALKVVGGSDGRFDPDGIFDRQSAAVLTANLLDALGAALPESEPTFTDKADISGWARARAGQVQAAGIMVGSGGKLDPKGKYDRQSGIMAMLNLWDYLSRED